MTPSEAIATRSRRSRCQARAQGLRPSIGAGARPAGPAPRAGRSGSVLGDGGVGVEAHALCSSSVAVISLSPTAGWSWARSSPPCSGCRQAVTWSGRSSRTGAVGGSAAAQSSRARGQRVWKRQPARRVGRGRQVADEDDPLAAVRDVGVGDGQRGEQGPGVGVARVREELAGGGHLDDLAEVHHRDPVAHVAHDRQVVGDEDVGEAELGLEVEEQVEHLGLDRDVEGRHRLVADDQPRAAGPAPGPRRSAAAGRRRTRPGSGCSARG